MSPTVPEIDHEWRDRGDVGLADEGFVQDSIVALSALL